MPFRVHEQAFLPRVKHLDGPTGLLGQQRDVDLSRDVFLAAEPAAGQCCHDTNRVRLYAQRGGRLVAVLVRNLAADIDRGLVVPRGLSTHRRLIDCATKFTRVVACRDADRAFRFEKQVLCALRPERSVDDHISGSETGFDVAFVDPYVFQQVAVTTIVMNKWRPGLRCLQRIGDIIVQGGSNLRDLNLPIDPNGVVYDAVGRTPIAGAILTLVDGRTNAVMPSSCFDDPAQQGQVTLADGYYKFDLNFADPACASNSLYTIQVTPPNSNYVSGVSELIPPTSDLSTAPFDVPACAGSTDDAVPATAQHCEAQTSEFAPPTSVAARSTGTVYHSLLRLDGTRLPGTAQLFNNHIPLDPRLDGAIAVTKTTSAVNVSRGQMVPYTITVSNSFGIDLQDVNVIDRVPPGFRYVEGSARIDGVKTEPQLVGRELHWTDLTLATDGRHELKLLMAVGAGVSEGEFTNRALAVNALTGGVMSEEATATVRLVPYRGINA